MSESTCSAIIWIWIQIPYSRKEAKNGHAYSCNDKFNIRQIVGKHGCMSTHVLYSRNWFHIFIYELGFVYKYICGSQRWAVAVILQVPHLLSYGISLAWNSPAGHWAPAIHVPASLALGLQGCSIILSSFTGSCNGTQLLVLTTQALHQLNCPCSFNF